MQVDYDYGILLLEILKKTGIPGTCVAFLLFILPKLKRIQKTLSSYYTHKLDIPRHTEQALFINEALDQIKQRLCACRISIAQYHNGGVNVQGVAFTKVSVTHERARYGVPLKVSEVQGIPVSLITWLVSPMVNENFLRIPSTEKFRETDEGGFQFLLNRNVKSFYAISMNSLEGTPVGFVTVEFCGKEVVLNKEQLSKTLATVLKVCGSLLDGEG